MKDVLEFMKKHRDWCIAAAFLVVLVAILLLPTVRTIRTVEIDPKKTTFEPIGMEAGEYVENKVQVPAGEIEYFLTWVKDKHDFDGQKHIDVLTEPDYERLQLEIVSPAGELVRTSIAPKLIKRAGEPALLFTFDSITTNEGDEYVFGLRQTGDGVVWVLPSLADNVHDGEEIETSVQLGERRNWITLLIDRTYDEKFDGNDISYYMFRGSQIARGENPYDCVLQDKCAGYPAHLPGMYLVAGSFSMSGIDELDEWASAWRPIAFTLWVVVGLVLLVAIFRLKQPALAVASFGFWLFNRWSIEVLKIAHTDIAGVLFLMLSVLLAARYPLVAAILLGVSLSVKQVAAFVVPVFLIIAWRSSKSVTVGRLLLLTGLVVLVPLLTSAPFLFDNPEATLKGWFNAVERPSQTVHGFAPSIDVVLDVSNKGKSLMMFLLIAMVYVAAWRKKIGLLGGTLMVMTILISFTHVLYNQYLVWFLPFIPLAIAHIARLKE